MVLKHGISLLLLAIYTSDAFLLRTSSSSATAHKPQLSFLSSNSTENNPEVDDFLRHKLLESISKEEKESLQKAVSGPDYQLLLIADSRNACMLDNFIAHTQTHIPGGKIVLITLDEPSQNYCLRQSSSSNFSMKMHCVDFSRWWQQKQVAFGKHLVASGEHAAFGSTNYHLVCWLKPVALSIALQAVEKGILLIDLDVVLSGNLLDWCIKNDDPATLMMFGDEHGEINSGTVFATKRTGVDNFMKAWLAEARLDHVTADQGALQGLLRAKPKDYPVKMMPLNITGTCNAIGKLATHANCNHDKISRLKEIGFWKPVNPQCK